MENTNKYIDNNAVEILSNISTEKKNVLYYSLEQVATLLGETTEKIRYYTNIFDNILKVEINNKELKYKNIDINKLDFLIRLKNKGMTLKEIEDYYASLPSSSEDDIEFKESNLLSVNELINKILFEQDKQLATFKKDLLHDLAEKNSSNTKKLSFTLTDNQNHYMNSYKDELLANINENNSTHVENLLNILIEKQNENLLKIKEDLIKDFESLTTCHMKTLSSKFIEIQNESINKLKSDLSIELKQEINNHLNAHTIYLKDSIDNIMSKLDDFLSDITHEKDTKLHESLCDNFNEFKSELEEQSNNTIKQIQSFKDVITRAYLLEDEIEKTNKSSIFSRLFCRYK